MAEYSKTFTGTLTAPDGTIRRTPQALRGTPAYAVRARRCSSCDTGTTL